MSHTTADEDCRTANGGHGYISTTSLYVQVAAWDLYKMADISQTIFQMHCILIQILLKFVLSHPIHNK